MVTPISDDDVKRIKGIVNFDSVESEIELEARLSDIHEFPKRFKDRMYDIMKNDLKKSSAETAVRSLLADRMKIKGSAILSGDKIVQYNRLGKPYAALMRKGRFKTTIKLK